MAPKVAAEASATLESSGCRADTSTVRPLLTCSRRWTAILAVAALAPALVWVAAAPATAAKSEHPHLGRSVIDRPDLYAPGEAIVRFERGAPASLRRTARRHAGVEFDSTLRLPHAQVVEVDGSVELAVRRLERQPGVAYAQPNYRYEALAAPQPDDTFFEELWALSDPALPDPGINALEAWEASTGTEQTIAIVDTGVDLTHPDIAANLWTNETPDPIDKDVHGYDFVDEDGNPDDYNFHGTHVAATAAGTANNAEGTAGVAPEAKIMGVRVLDGDGSGFTSDVADGISYAAEHGAGVINLSLGGPAGEDEATEEAIEAAAAEGAVIVAAAGNEEVDNDKNPQSPCVLPQTNLICVAALNQDGGLAGFSNYGATSVDLSAPGTAILSAKPDYGPALFSDDFEAGAGNWDVFTSNGGVPWGMVAETGGNDLIADSPGGDYGAAEDASEAAVSELFKPSPLDFSGERGCRVHFKTRYQIEPPAPDGILFDALFAGAWALGSEGFEFTGLPLAGESRGFAGGGMIKEEVSLSRFDGRIGIEPAFVMVSDEQEQLDGAYLDDLRYFCRDQTYSDVETTFADWDQPDAGSYFRLNGTSMATPHVAGIVALVQAAAPGLSANEVVDAVLEGTSAMPSPDDSRPTATSGIADACKAVAVATGGDVAASCPASSDLPESPPVKVGDGEVVTEDLQEPLPSPGSPPSQSVPPEGREPFVDRLRPRAFFRQRPRRVIRTRFRRGKVVFRFGSNERGVRFICRLDRRRWWRFCRRRVAWRLGRGRHVLRVRAIDASRNVSPRSAIHRFRIVRVRGSR